MKQEILSESILKFYTRRNFGKKISACGGEDKALDVCIAGAWRDATIRERFKGKQNSPILQNKDKIQNMLKTELTEKFTQIESDFAAWHKTMCENTSFGMRCGVWQKLINMTFKYIYCARHMKNIFTKFDAVFAKCHCPVDSQIAQKAYECMENSNIHRKLMKAFVYRNGINWNSIDYDRYLEFQSAIDEFAAKEGITPLEFDMKYWNA